MKIYKVYGWRDGYDVAPVTVKYFESKRDANEHVKKILRGVHDYAKIDTINVIKKRVKK